MLMASYKAPFQHKLKDNWDLRVCLIVHSVKCQKSDFEPHPHLEGKSTPLHVSGAVTFTSRTLGHWVSIALEDPEGSLFQVNLCVFVEVRLCPLGSFSSSRRVGFVADQKRYVG